VLDPWKSSQAVAFVDPVAGVADWKDQAPELAGGLDTFVKVIGACPELPVKFPNPELGFEGGNPELGFEGGKLANPEEAGVEAKFPNPDADADPPDDGTGSKKLGDAALGFCDGSSKSKRLGAGADVLD